MPCSSAQVLSVTVAVHKVPVDGLSDCQKKRKEIISVNASMLV